MNLQTADRMLTNLIDSYRDVVNEGLQHIRGVIRILMDLIPSCEDNEVSLRIDESGGNLHISCRISITGNIPDNIIDYLRDEFHSANYWYFKARSVDNGRKLLTLSWRRTFYGVWLDELKHTPH